jgi:hypothetical protein
MWNLAEALAQAVMSDPAPSDIDAIRLQCDRPFARLSEIVGSLSSRSDRRICLLVDQFEELFQHARAGNREEAMLFLELVTGTLDASAESPLRVVLTMRSEYLGECARLPGLARAVNDAQYLVPRMGTDALRRAIRRPAELFGGVVAADVADRLIADVAGDQDELPLIQHGLRRMWDPAKSYGPDPPRLTLAFYEKNGPLQRLLDAHANALLGQASPDPGDERLVAEIFRALTDTNADAQAMRRPRRFVQLAEIAGADPLRVAAILEPFRTESASFVTPYAPAPLLAATVVDIGHEALIRCWKRLSNPGTGWHAQEIGDGLIWRALLTQAESYERDPASLLGAAAERVASWTDERMVPPVR